mmetsp:Transcript_58613/g.166741  ORF Transcript_58613/g.166741 Transcript_58613/m.166741 type:complete len:562 (-) Transcript_58613:989-2674(-)
MVEQDLAGPRVHDADGAGLLDHEGLVVRPVLLRLLCHQPNVWHRAHGGRVELPILLAVLDDHVEDGGVAAVGDAGLAVLELVSGRPHLPRLADHGGHGRVNDDVAGHMEVRDALVRVDHGQLRPALEDGLNVSLDGTPFRLGEGGHLRHDVAPAVVRVRAQALQGRAVLLEYLVEILADHVAEHDGVRDLHHGCLQVEREEDVLLLGVLDLRLVERPQAHLAHVGGVDHLAREQRGLGLQHGRGPVVRRKLDPDLCGIRGHVRLLAGVEVALGHVRHVRLAVWAPLAHFVRVLLGVVLDRNSGPAVRIPLAQHWVHRATQHLGVPRLDPLLLVILRIVGIVGQSVALRLKLCDAGLQLRDGGADVGQLHNVGRRRFGQVPERGQLVVLAHVLGQLILKGSNHAAGDRDIPELDVDASLLREGANDGQQSVSGQHRRLVSERVHDGRAGHHFLLQHLRDAVYHLSGVQELPTILAARSSDDQVLRDLALVHSLHGGCLQLAREVRELRVVVQLGAMLQAADPREDVHHRVDGRLTTVHRGAACRGGAGRLGQQRLAVGAQHN